MINVRANNQIVHTFISQILDPTFYSMLVTKSTNQGKLVHINLDNNNDKVIDGNILLLLIAMQICPSTRSMVANIKAKAKEPWQTTNTTFHKLLESMKTLLSESFLLTENAGIKKSLSCSKFSRLPRMINL